MAEIELSVLERTMKIYIAKENTCRSKVQTLTNERDSSLSKVNWQFYSADSRTKLLQRYPSISARLMNSL
jgi:hypothetical protein